MGVHSIASQEALKRLAQGHLQCPEPLRLSAAPTVVGVFCRVVRGCSPANVGQCDQGFAENVSTKSLGLHSRSHEVVIRKSHT